MSLAEFVASFPRAAYTVARGDASGAVVDLGLHCERLRSSYELLFSQPCALSPQAIARGLGETSLARGQIRACVLYPPGVLECRDFPLVLSGTVDRVLVGVGEGRRLCRAKDSQWIADRKALERLKLEYACGEVVLTERGCELLEGLTSNLVVITEDGAVVTCGGDRALPGITLHACLHVLRELGHRDVRFAAPNWNDRATWRCAFLCSSTRPGQFITEMLHAGTGERVVFRPHPQLQRDFGLGMERYYYS